MKKSYLSFVLLLLCFFGRAQTIENFGNVLAEEFALKECSFDKEADAVVLLQEASSYYNNSYNLVTEHRVRLKILKEKGISYANVVIPYYADDDFEFIGNIEGVVLNQNADGSIQNISVDKKSIFRQTVNKYRGEVRIAFPAVRVGSIMEYKYVSTMKHYGGLDDWHFQREIPVVRSKYRLSVVPNAEFSYVVHKDSRFEVDVNQQTRDGIVTFEMKNIPALTDEPYMDARGDYLQRVAFQLSAYSSGSSNRKYMTSWDEVIRELSGHDMFGKQLNKNLSGTDEFIKLVKQQSAPEQRMKMVFDYVKNNMKWNGYRSKYSEDGVKNAWNKKTGNVGDINLILVNLLQSVDLQAHPMLVAERRLGSVNPKIPFIDQFHRTMATVIIGERKYYLDATDQFTPVHVIPSIILNTHALVVNRRSGGLEQITDNRLQYKDIVFVTANITDGKLVGKTTVTSTDYARVQRLEDYKDDANEYQDFYFKRALTNVLIDSFEVSGDTSDSLALKNQFNFNLPLNANGDYLFVPLNLFTGYAINPFLANNRFSSINFGYKKLVALTFYFDVPKGYKIDELPKSLMVTNADKTIACTREVFEDQNSGKIMVRLRVDCKKSFYTADEYPEIKELYKKMFDLLNEQVVLKK